LSGVIHFVIIAIAVQAESAECRYRRPDDVLSA